MFNSARLKLTAWYVLIIMTISIAFSAVIYNVSTRELDRFDQLQRARIERRLGSQRVLVFVDPVLIEETRNRLLVMLIGINSGILLVSGATAYFLAGRTLQPIKKMVDDQNRFISDASHELRTPLTALKTSLEVSLRDSNLSLQEAKEVLIDSVDDVNKLQSLSDSLLQLSRYQQTDTKADFAKVSLLQIASEAVEKVKPLAKKKEVNIENTVKDVKVVGSKDRLLNLFVILLDNAIKYSSENTRVEMTSAIKDRYAVINVKDQGVGISAKDLPYIFDRFYRADSARSKEDAGGYGLGLAIAKKIVEIHNGTISVQSKSGKGSTFTITLPRFS